MLCLDNSLQPLQSQPATVESCSYVLLSGVEAVSAASSPFNLSIAEGQAIGAAIFTCWGIAFAFRAIRDFLSGWSSDRSISEE